MASGDSMIQKFGCMLSQSTRLRLVTRASMLRSAMVMVSMSPMFGIPSSSTSSGGSPLTREIRPRVIGYRLSLEPVVRSSSFRRPSTS